MRYFFEKLVFSLPLQLAFNHFRKNLALLAIWGIIVAAFSGNLGKVYGIHYLFLDPEYLGEVNFWSFFIVGIAFGNLIMAFHITSYILDSHKFRFIAVLHRPFAKFSLNNSLIPVLILAIYMLTIVQFQLNNEYASGGDIALYCVGLVLGMHVIILVLFGYFKWTNKDIFKYVASTVDRKLRKSLISRDRMMKKLNENKRNKYKISCYIDFKFRVRSTARIIDFSNREAILKVFDQNHFNSVLIELIIIGVILLLGFFIDLPLLQIPAAASALLIFSIAVMLIGAISFWFKNWGLTFALGLFVVVNILVQNGYGKGINQAAGLNYETKAEYTVESLRSVHSEEQRRQDKRSMIRTLENWKAKLPDTSKQKMVFLCVSGGGQRAALWTVTALSAIDSLMNGDFMKNNFLITGASGGIVGAAYYREMFRNGMHMQSNQMRQRIGKDNLNPIIFSLLVNDLFVKFKSYEFESNSYKVDRGYVFEQNLNRNLGGIMEGTLLERKRDEEMAKIPTLIMSPTVANDGRKLYVSAQPISYLSISDNEQIHPDIRGADFQALFKNQEAAKLRFLSALRMSASFPYITPTISLPSEPRVEIMDAGISDNFGVMDAIRFLHVFQEWITENTSGVVMVVIRDTKRSSPIEDRPIPSIMDRITYPIASVYNNLANMQDINNDFRVEQARKWFNCPLDVVEISYDSFKNGSETEVERASLSWHLTGREKANITANIKTEENSSAIQQIKRLLQ